MGKENLNRKNTNKEGKKMRKTISVLLIVLVGLMMFTACNPESSISDALVKVRLVDGNSRALSASLNFDVNKVKRWEYSAVKADNGLKTGETKGTSGDVTTAVLDENKQTAALSQGAWNFYLYGYDAALDGNLICKGSAMDVLITSESNSVSITVNPLQEKTGVIAIDNNIDIVDKNGKAYDKGTGDDEYTKTVTVTKFSDSSVVTADSNSSITGYTTYSVDSGTYKVVVTYTATHNGTQYTAATATKYVNVYDHLTTKVSGTITESEQAATINAEGSFEGTATVTATFASVSVGGQSVTANSEATTLKFDYTPVGKKGTEASGTDNLESTFVFPAGSLKKTADNETVSIEYKTASAGTAAKTYEITDAIGAVVAAVDITANGFDSTNLEGSDGSYPVLTTFIGKDLGASFDTTDSDTSNVSVTLGIQYYGDFVETDNDKAELLAYDSETGYLKYSPKHFSTYVIFSNKYALTDDNGAMYETLADAVEKAADGATITLWKDIDLTETLSIEKSLTIDMNGHNIKANSAETYKSGNPFYIFNITESNVTFEIKNSSETESVISEVGRGISSGLCIKNGLKNVTATINKNVKIETPTGVLVVSGTLNVYGKLYVTTREFAISGNATKDWEAADPGTVINLYEGAEVKSTATVGDKTGMVAIYQPQKGILNIKGATVEGYSGICIRSGELNISNGSVIKGTANDNQGDVNYEGGALYGGAAITICSSSSSYHGNMKISISDSTLESQYTSAITELYTSSDKTTKINSLEISGNSKLTSGSNAICDISLKETSKAKITGGTFSKDPSNYVKDGYEAKKSGDGTWTVQKETT